MTWPGLMSPNTPLAGRTVVVSTPTAAVLDRTTPEAIAPRPELETITELTSLAAGTKDHGSHERPISLGKPVVQAPIVGVTSLNVIPRSQPGARLDSGWRAHVSSETKDVSSG